jgi:3-oxoadipate enol-lactonase/4-carboxymuconolactone decarboxylase
VWGEIWARPGLDRKMRSAVSITALTAGGYHHKLAPYVSAAIRNGMTKDEIKEVLLQTSVYCGFPAATDAFLIAQRVLEDNS